MPNNDDLDAETARRRDVVLEFINRKPESSKSTEDKLLKKIKEEDSITSKKIEDIAKPESTVVLLTAEKVGKVTALMTNQNSCQFKPRVPVEVKTGSVIVPEKKYDGPLICIVPKKDRMPKAPVKRIRRKALKVVEKKHHGSRRESGGAIRNFLRTLSDFLK